MAQEMLNQYCIDLQYITNMHYERVYCVFQSVTSIVMETEVNPSVAEAGIYCEESVNVMATDALAPGDAKPSAAMILII